MEVCSEQGCRQDLLYHPLASKLIPLVCMLAVQSDCTQQPNESVILCGPHRVLQVSWDNNLSNLLALLMSNDDWKRILFEF